MSRLLCYTRDELADSRSWMGLMAAVMGGVWLFLELLVDILLVCGADGPDTAYFSIAAVGAMGAGGFAALIISGAVFSQGFLMAVSMGRTRRGFIASAFLAVSAITLAAFCLAVPLAWLSEGVRCLAMPGLAVVKGGSITDGNAMFWLLENLPLWILPLTALSCAAVGMLMGALLLRCGRVGFWVMWALWMLVSIGGSNVATAYRRGTLAAPAAAVLRFFGALLGAIPGAMAPLVWLLGIGLCAGAGTALLWRAPVK